MAMRWNYLTHAFLGVGVVVSMGAAQASDAQATGSLSIYKGEGAAPSVSQASLRVSLVRDAAMSAAMRIALAKQTELINKLLDEHARLLDDAYDFSTLMLPDNVVPPVVRKIERITEQSGDVLSYSSAKFQILRQAVFATRAPTWRTYLPIPIWNDVGTTHESLKPRNSEEREAAEQGIAKGWKAGTDQANAMFFKGLTRLQNDWIGMNTYHALLKSRMVTAPIVNRQDTAISGTNDSMVVDQSTYRIEAKPVFNPNLTQWLALIDKAGTSSLLSSINKPTAAESARVNLTTPSQAELLRTWTGK